MSRFRRFAEGSPLSAIGRGLYNTFIRDNRILPPVLAVLALFVFAWIVAGALLGGGVEEPVSNRASEVAQAQGQAQPSPGVDAPDVDSYAAYRSKDPFRELIAQASEGGETTTGTQPDDGAQQGDGTQPGGTPPGGTPPGDGAQPGGPSPGDGAGGEETTAPPRDSGRGRDDPGRTRPGGAGRDQYEDRTRRGRERTDNLFDSGGNLQAPGWWGWVRP